MIGAYSKVQIVQLLEYMSNEDVAKVAKISVKIIEQIKNIEFSKEQEFRMLLIEDGGYEYIMEKYGYASKELVDYYRKKMRAYNRRMIEELLEKKTDDEIAKIAQIPKELVSKIRENAKMQEKLKTAKKKVKTKVRNQKIKEKRNKAKKISIEEGKKELKERRNILRQMIQEVSEEISASSRNKIEKYIIELIADLEPYFSTLDYTFVGHAFMKIGLYDEGIMYISTNLGLKDISIVGAQARISEILTNEKQKKENVRRDIEQIEYEER